MTDSLELLIARDSGQDFHAEVMRQHKMAMSCRNCEDWLNKGIKAFLSLQRAEAVIREGIARELVADPKPTEFDEAIYTLYLGWLQTSAQTDEWIAKLAEKEYTPDNLAEYRRCYDEVRTWMEQNQWKQRSRQARANLFSDEPF